MKIHPFIDQTSKIGDKLIHISDHIYRTREVLERLLNAEGEIEITEWTVRAGKIYITFTSSAEIENVPDNETYVQKSLVAMFPSCSICGTLVEIEHSELL